jgi:hypothetical protein
MNGLTGLIGSGSRRPKWLRFSPALTAIGFRNVKTLKNTVIFKDKWRAFFIAI